MVPSTWHRRVVKRAEQTSGLEAEPLPSAHCYGHGPTYCYQQSKGTKRDSKIMTARTSILEPVPFTIGRSRSQSGTYYAWG